MISAKPAAMDAVISGRSQTTQGLSSRRSAAFVALSAFVHLSAVAFFVSGSGDKATNMIGDQQIEVQFVLAEDVVRSLAATSKVREKNTIPKIKSVETASATDSPAVDSPVAISPPTESAHPSVRPEEPILRAGDLSTEPNQTSAALPVQNAIGGGRAPTSAEAGYLSEIQKLLESKKEYPLAARRMGHRGRVVVRFIVERDGHVREAKIIQASQSEILNRAARGLIEKISGLKPFPSEIVISEWAVVVPIEYQM